MAALAIELVSGDLKSLVDVLIVKLSRCFNCYYYGGGEGERGFERFEKFDLNTALKQ